MPTTALTTITMPQLGESVIEGTIGNWLKAIGDSIAKYDALVEVETDKATAELPAPVSGTLMEILIEPGTTVPVGTGLCRIQESGGVEAGSSLTDVGRSSLPNSGASAHQNVSVAFSPVEEGQEIPDETTLLRARSSPIVRRLAQEHGIDIARISGTGTGGRVTKRDVLEYVGQQASWAPQDSDSEDEASSTVPVGRGGIVLSPGDEVIPVSAMRRTIAENMVRSERTAPHATVVMEVDMTQVVARRTARKDEFRRREGVDLTYLPIVLQAVAGALRIHPRLNAIWDETRIIHRKAINIGIAVALDDGLVVPVITDADRLSVAGLAHAIADLTVKARAGLLVPDDMAGGTFTVNNPGTFGSLVSTPILVQPQVAILSTEAIIKRPVVIDAMIGIRSMMNLSLSIDHRALDGLAAARFLQRIKQLLEEGQF